MNKKKKMYVSVMMALLICGLVFLVMSLEGDHRFLAPALDAIALANVVNLVRIWRERKGK